MLIDTKTPSRGHLLGVLGQYSCLYTSGMVQVRLRTKTFHLMLGQPYHSVFIITVNYRFLLYGLPVSLEELTFW